MHYLLTIYFHFFVNVTYVLWRSTYMFTIYLISFIPWWSIKLNIYLFITSMLPFVPWHGTICIIRTYVYSFSVSRLFLGAWMLLSNVIVTTFWSVFIRYDSFLRQNDYVAAWSRAKMPGRLNVGLGWDFASNTDSAWDLLERESYPLVLSPYCNHCTSVFGRSSWW